MLRGRAQAIASATLLLANGLHAQDFSWPHDSRAERVEQRLPPPPGYRRISAEAGSYAAWLRRLPLRPAGTPVQLFDGRLKANQSAQVAVLDIDTGRRDLQQCADAAMRLRAEFQRASGCAAEIAFRFTSGHLARWSDWANGQRPQVRGNRVSWRRSAAADRGYRNFRAYLDSVFTYAGSYSLALEMSRSDGAVLPGDIFIRGGFPGHAVTVIDVAENTRGERIFLLAQSYMPAQQMHILHNPAQPDSAWYRWPASGDLLTPEWRFRYEDRRRFAGPSATVAPKCSDSASSPP